MRTDGHDQPRFALPATDHEEASGPLSVVVRAMTWAVLAWRHRRSAFAAR